MFTSVGGKAALLKLALDWALVGDDEPVPMSGRPVIAEMEQLTDPSALVAGWAQFVAELEERAAPLATVLVVARLAATDGLRPGLTERAVAAALVFMDPAVHRTLVREHGWTRHEYVDWLERAAVAELLEARGCRRHDESTRSTLTSARPGRNRRPPLAAFSVDGPPEVMQLGRAHRIQRMEIRSAAPRRQGG